MEHSHVRFITLIIGKKALEMLKIAPINGKRWCVPTTISLSDPQAHTIISSRVMPYERDSTFRSSGYGNLFIKNLDPDFTEIVMNPFPCATRSF